jgi:hypothetical protein
MLGTISSSDSLGSSSSDDDASRANSPGRMDTRASGDGPPREDDHPDLSSMGLHCAGPSSGAGEPAATPRASKPTMSYMREHITMKQASPSSHKEKYKQRKDVSQVLFVGAHQANIPYDKGLQRYAHDYSVGPEAQGRAHGNLWLWLPHQSSPHLNPKERRMLNRWNAITPVPSILGHHQYHPRLLPAVTVPVTALPWASGNAQSTEAFYMAWAEADFLCPVEGCEPLEASKDKRGHANLPRPTAAPEGLTRPGGAFRRQADGTLDLLDVLRPHGEHHRPPGRCHTRLEHWMAFHMRAGSTFAVPCCSNTPDDQLPPTCTVHCDLSLSSAMYHLDKVHGAEIDQLVKEKNQSRTPACRQ